MLGRAKNVFINFRRDTLSTCKKPQLDFNHSSGKLKKSEKSRFKILKAKQSQRRDNKLVALNSDDEVTDSEEECKTEEQATKDDFKKFVQPIIDESLEMEFDSTAPLQDSKDYYAKTQKHESDVPVERAMYPIDEEERESAKTSNIGSMVLNQSQVR